MPSSSGQTNCCATNTHTASAPKRATHQPSGLFWCRVLCELRLPLVPAVSVHVFRYRSIILDRDCAHFQRRFWVQFSRLMAFLVVCTALSPELINKTRHGTPRKSESWHGQPLSPCRHLDHLGFTFTFSASRAFSLLVLIYSKRHTNAPRRRRRRFIFWHTHVQTHHRGAFQGFSFSKCRLC